MNESPESDRPPDEPDSADCGMEMSLKELGRTYARAVGLIPDTAEEDPETPDEPVNDQSVCPISPKSILEAMLFVGSADDDDPLTTPQIASWIRDVSPREISQLARELDQQYGQEGAAFRIRQDRQQLRLVLGDHYEPVREQFYGEVRKARLSQQAIDVLAIVAYHQPTTREHISELRSRDCSSVLGQLVKRQLLTLAPDADNPRVQQYRTTDRFLKLFGLDSLEDLPQSAESLLPDADIE